MAINRLPAYVNIRQLAGGVKAYYWVRPAWATPPAARNGKTCPYGSTALGTDVAEAIQKANAINEGFREWRLGVESAPVKGSVKWLFIWYREQDRFTKNRHKTRKEYRSLMDAIEAVPMKVGTFGDRLANRVDATAADNLYKKVRQRGERQASYMMEVARLVWTWAVRHSGTTGVKDNPFAGMGIKSRTKGGNRATGRAEYDLYRETARAMGYPEMATAAALAFESCQRTWDVFGFEDPDGIVERGILWERYTPGVLLTLQQSKTGNLVELPLSDTIVVEGKPEKVLLYPELEAELARTPEEQRHGLIVLDHRSGKPFKLDWMQKLHRKIRVAAGLPEGMTFTGFRHGGITEIGDSGEADVRSVSGHKTLDQTATYNKANQEKARRIAAKRREHIALMGGLDAAEQT